MKFRRLILLGACPALLVAGLTGCSNNSDTDIDMNEGASSTAVIVDKKYLSIDPDEIEVDQESDIITLPVSLNNFSIEDSNAVRLEFTDLDGKDVSERFKYEAVDENVIEIYYDKSDLTPLRTIEFLRGINVEVSGGLSESEAYNIHLTQETPTFDPDIPGMLKTNTSLLIYCVPKARGLKSVGASADDFSFTGDFESLSFDGSLYDGKITVWKLPLSSISDGQEDLLGTMSVDLEGCKTAFDEDLSRTFTANLEMLNYENYILTEEEMAESLLMITGYEDKTANIKYPEGKAIEMTEIRRSDEGKITKAQNYVKANQNASASLKAPTKAADITKNGAGMSLGKMLPTMIGMQVAVSVVSSLFSFAKKELIGENEDSEQQILEYVQQIDRKINKLTTEVLNGFRNVMVVQYQTQLSTYDGIKGNLEASLVDTLYDRYLTIVEEYCVDENADNFVNSIKERILPYVTESFTQNTVKLQGYCLGSAAGLGGPLFEIYQNCLEETYNWENYMTKSLMENFLDEVFSLYVKCSLITAIYYQYAGDFGPTLDKFVSRDEEVYTIMDEYAVEELPEGKMYCYTTGKYYQKHFYQSDAVALRFGKVKDANGNEHVLRSTIIHKDDYAQMLHRADATVGTGVSGEMYEFCGFDNYDARHIIPVGEDSYDAADSTCTIKKTCWYGPEYGQIDVNCMKETPALKRGVKSKKLISANTGSLNSTFGYCKSKITTTYYYYDPIDETLEQKMLHKGYNQDFSPKDGGRNQYFGRWFCSINSDVQFWLPYGYTNDSNGMIQDRSGRTDDQYDDIVL